MQLTITLMIAIIGVIMGSFTNAWAVRLLKGQSIAKGRSKCPKCHHQLAWYDNVPLLSYAILWGNCRYCKKPISAQYPVVELASGLLFAGLYLHFQPTNIQGWITLVLWCILSIFLIASFITDWIELVLPDNYMVPAIVLSLLIAVVASYISGQGIVWSVVFSRILQAGIFVAIYSALYFGSKGKFIGDGDIRLAAILGLALALPQLFVAVFATYIIGAAIGSFCILTKLKTRKDVIAFGPFLIIGLYIGLFWGEQIARWYLHLF